MHKIQYAHISALNKGIILYSVPLLNLVFFSLQYCYGHLSTALHKNFPQDLWFVYEVGVHLCNAS